MWIFYDLDVVTKAFKDVDVVYHCAATPHEGLSVFSPYFITRNNLGYFNISHYRSDKK